ncbi:hypothetical protein [Bartonella rattimassiliensis]|uniref:Uncharacterized protein n=1 Tax=Bartonella rattimassiliensis 15908 TaxID=1094556 RepID=J1JL51_9HYPH|nr:hypothetical protein [Bartonella rattimassiliensis]EJF84960.1 hypothetical protein MCY_01343 [Bartonella rattimassiliensis 15908]
MKTITIDHFASFSQNAFQKHHKTVDAAILPHKVTTVTPIHLRE